MTDLELAEKIRDLYAAEPTLESLAVADGLGISLALVWRIIDEYEVLDDGSVQHNGPGRGGGWVPAQEVSMEAVGQPAGYRWLDGSLHEEPDPKIMRAMVEYRSQVEADE